MDMPNESDDSSKPAGGSDPVSPSDTPGTTLPGNDDSNKSPTDTTIPPVKAPTTPSSTPTVPPTGPVTPTPTAGGDEDGKKTV